MGVTRITREKSEKGKPEEEEKAKLGELKLNEADRKRERGPC